MTDREYLQMRLEEGDGSTSHRVHRPPLRTGGWLRRLLDRVRIRRAPAPDGARRSPPLSRTLQLRRRCYGRQPAPRGKRSRDYRTAALPVCRGRDRSVIPSAS